MKSVLVSSAPSATQGDACNRSPAFAQSICIPAERTTLFAHVSLAAKTTVSLLAVIWPDTPGLEVMERAEATPFFSSVNVAAAGLLAIVR
jgi:hypothetical protein